MKISTKSGHYRCVNRLSEVVGTPSSSLCVYFWQALIAINLHIMIPVGVVLAPLLFGGILGGPLKDLPLLLSIYTLLSVLVGTMVGALGVIWGLGLATISIVFFLESIFPYIQKLIGFQEGNSSPNVVVEYLKAKKAKVCPIITYTEE